ncbi:MAG: 6-bladed beta-propeller [Rhodothermales bacterium]
MSRFKKGLLGTEENNLIPVKRPFDVHVDQQGVIFVTSGLGGSIRVFDPTAKDAWLLTPEGGGVLAKPMGLGGDSQGYLFVADPVLRRVVSYGPDGEFAQAYGGRNVLLNPVDVAVSPAGDRVYVTDSYLHQLVVFDRNGTLLRRVGRDEGDIAAKEEQRAAAGKTNDPHLKSQPSDLSVNRGTGDGEFRYPAFVDVAPDGTVYVSDGMNFRVQAFDADGNYLLQFGRQGQTPGAFARPKGVAVDSDGHVYVVDAAFNNVQIFSPQGDLLLSFGDLGASRGELYIPGGVMIDENDQIFVADRYNNRLQIFQYLPNPEEETAQAADDAAEPSGGETPDPEADAGDDQAAPAPVEEEETPPAQNAEEDPASEVEPIVSEGAPVAAVPADPEEETTEAGEATPVEVSTEADVLRIDPDEGGYTWIVGYRTQQDQAETLAAQIREQLGDPSIRVGVLTTIKDGATLYRIGVGQLASAGEAQAFRTRLGSVLPGDAWLFRVQRDQ